MSNGNQYQVHWHRVLSECRGFAQVSGCLWAGESHPIRHPILECRALVVASTNKGRHVRSPGWLRTCTHAATDESLKFAVVRKQVLQENAQLEAELVRVRGGNLRAAQILAVPLLQQDSPDRGGNEGEQPPQTAATGPGGPPSVSPHVPPPPDPAPPKRPRHQ